jgi:hypothetical protein
MSYYSSSAHNTIPLSSEYQDTQSANIHRNIERFLSGKVLQPLATPVVEEVLLDQAMRHNLVYDARNIALELEARGYFVSLQYCNSNSVGHPVPFLVIRTQAGESVIPDVSSLRSELHGTELTVIDCGPLRPGIANDDKFATPCPGAVVLMPSTVHIHQ